MARGSYTDEFKALAVARYILNGGNLQGTAKEMGLEHKNTLRNWVQKHEESPDPLVEEKLEEAKDLILVQNTALAQAAYERLMETIPEASSKTANDIYKNAVNTIRTVQGKATQITENRGIDQNDLSQVVNAVMTALAEQSERSKLVRKLRSSGDDVVDAEVIEQPALGPAAA